MFSLNDIKRSGYFLPGLYLWYALIWCVGFIVNPRPSRFSLTLFAGGFIVFAFHILCCGPFWVSFMERVRHLSRFVYFVCGSLLIPGPLVEKVVLLISTQMTRVAWVFFWAFYSDPLNELSFPSLVPRGVDYCSYLLFWPWIVHASPLASTLSILCYLFWAFSLSIDTLQ